MMKIADATLSRGYGVASGTSQKGSPLSEGSIKMQAPFFKQAGLDFATYFKAPFVYGTLNLEIHNTAIRLINPKYRFNAINWTDVCEPENFFLSDCQLIFRSYVYSGLIYLPDPKTKINHLHKSNIIEVIAETIPGISYGDALSFAYNEDEFSAT